MRHMALLNILLVSLLITFNQVSAQGNDDSSCPTIVENALELIDVVCESTGRNQACYGHSNLDAELDSDAENFSFSTPGDIVDIVTVDTLRSSALDVENGTWGVALIRIQANLPGTIPGQNVQFIIFGDTVMDRFNDSEIESATMNIEVNSGINVRSGPSTNFSIAGNLSSGDVVTANGRTEDGQWLRILIPSTQEHGWIYAPLLTINGDANILSVVDDSNGASTFGPMQAFYFETGIQAVTCIEAPRNGIFVQTPEGVGEITLQINEVTIQLGSTAFLQTTPDNEMRINVIEGHALVEAFGVQQEARMNMRIRVPLDENQAAAGSPLPPEPCDTQDLQGLSTELGLCEQVDFFLGAECPVTIPFGMRVHLFNPFGGYDTRELAHIDYDVDTSISIDGQEVSGELTDLYTYDEDGVESWGFYTDYSWEDMEAGTYVVEGNDPQSGVTRTCEFTVLEAP